MSCDLELSRCIAAMGDRADVYAKAGHANLEGAFLACRLMLIEAAFEDGVELGADQLGFTFGVVDV